MSSHFMKAPAPLNPMRFFWWLRHILYSWVRTKVMPEKLAAELGLQPGVPVCYIINTSSMADLLVLDQICRDYKLPLPHHKRSALSEPGTGAYIYLQKQGFLQVARERGKRPPEPLAKLVGMAASDKSMDVQLVPVSVFWGRNPGRDERSLMKLLFFDDEHAGFLQKMLIVLAQGRSNFVQFGKPISLREMVDEGLAPDETSRKLRRVLRVHFRQQRTLTTGPSLPSRDTVIGSLLGTKAVRQAVQEEARKKKISIDRAEYRARRYLLEISADTKYSVVRFFDIILTWLWNRMFNGVVIRHAHRLRDIPQTSEIVYLPCHRSHMDYLLLAYSIYYQGFVPPHTAAGVNLNFWPVGPLLRRGGAFYIRRSFGGNRLYTACFTEYVHYLLTKGHALKFYVEGGRSRTGRLLRPKTGMLSMTVHSYIRNSDKPIVFVPVYLGYDRVMEVKTYQSELRGAAKRKESVGQLMQARKALKTNFGKAYIGFGEPLALEDYLNSVRPDWRSEVVDPDERPKWLHPVIENLAVDVLTRVNATAVVSPLSLLGLVILASPQKAMSEDDLIHALDRLASLMRAAPYSDDVVLPEGGAEDLLREAMSVCKLQRFEHPGGDVFYLDEREAVLLTYYRNNALHLITLPALVASFFQHNDRLEEKQLIRDCKMLYPFLKSEFFLRWQVAELDGALPGVIEAMIDVGLLERDENPELVRRPDVTNRDLASLKILSRTMGQTLERYAVSVALLAQNARSKQLDRAEFETTCLLMAQRIALLSGINDPEFFDKGLFRHCVDLMVEQAYVQSADQGLIIDEQRVGDLANVAVKLLSSDIRQSLLRPNNLSAVKPLLAGD